MASLTSNNAPLSKKEQEEEEMRNELRDVGLYDDAMGVDEMKQLIAVINESKNDSRLNEDPNDSMAFKETRSVQDTSKNANSNLKPIPSFSYREAASSGSLSSQKSPSEESKNSNNKNAQASSSNLSDKNYGGNSDDSEPIYDKNSNCKKDADYPPLSGSRYKTRSTTADTRTRTQETKKLSLPTPKRSSLERWNLNILTFIKDKNTTPLYRPIKSERNVEEPLPYCSEAVDFHSEEFDELCKQMSEKLTSFNSQCMMTIGAKKTPPIKINYEDIPASTLTVKEKSFSTNTQGPNVSARNTYDRPSKRKALNTIAAATTNENVDENSGDEFSNTKKRKFQQGKKEEEEVKKSQENQKNKNIDKPIETISIDDVKDSFALEFDNSDFKNMRRSSNPKVSTNMGSSDEQQSQYPRRIEPPNPTKKNFKGPRAKKKNSTDTLMKTDPEKKKMLNLNDEDIKKTLQELDEQIDDCVDITGDIKPPQTPKPLSKKLQQATNHLENARELKEQKLKAAEIAKEQKEKEERLKRDELISTRLQQQENEEGRQLENQRKLNEQNAFYKSILDNKSRVTRSSFLQPEKTAEELAEDLLLGGDDDEPTITKVVQRQNCPICQKSFPPEDIENHASGCDAYAADQNEAYNRPSTSSRSNNIWKCHMCDRFETGDGHLYQEHTSKCKNAQESLLNGNWTKTYK